MSVRIEASDDQQKWIFSNQQHQLPLSKRHEYYVPIKKSNPLFDAFFISEEMVNPVLWVVQTTMAARHGGSKDGYVIIETIRERLGGDCDVKYVLVVPWHKRRAYRWEMPDGWNDHKGQVLIQYINMDTLGLNDDNVDSI
ncbi:hypothetical protein BDZ89DRAFT_1082152 [Hymenopellis radicata]|nr:hypothetical protein BDZ89DRAFT_1082152 [Hymenopellis radicata]